MPQAWNTTPALAIHRAYARGKRDFRNLSLAHVNFGDDLLGKSDALPDLRGADFSGSDLTGCRFVGADLRGSRFSRANLHLTNFIRSTADTVNFEGAYLGSSKLGLASLRGSVFDGADLTGSDFWHADLAGASMRDVDLMRVEFHGTRVTAAQMRRISINEATFIDTDLWPFCSSSLKRKSLAGVTIDWSSVARSFAVPHARLKHFLVQTGMPEVVAEYLLDSVHAESGSLIRSLMYSTFISYGGPDEAFALRLKKELHLNGVDTFLFATDAPPGERLHRVMYAGLNRYDRVVVVCSKASLDRPGVLNEIEETLAREARDGGATYLVPIRLDDYLFKSWKPPHADLATTLKSRVVGDFRGAQKSKGKFEAAMVRLLSVLKKPNREAAL